MSADQHGSESRVNLDLGKDGPPVLFVHGMWHAAWCWEFFLTWFRDAGFDAKAMNLRQHERRRGKPHRLKWWSLQDYVDDLKREIAELKALSGTTPILVGHSLGCLLIEIVMAEVRPPAVVLLAPTRHSIFRGSVWRFFTNHPFRFLQLFFTLTMWPPICTPELCREMLFSPALSEDDLRKWHGCLQNESYRLATQLLWGRGPKPAPPAGIPALVIIGDRDRAVTVEDAQEVAAHHGTTAEEMPGMPHDLMLDQGARKVADRIVEWIGNEGLAVAD
jgi:alpha-beta hydrolase superfamily lysophospholipase